MHVNRDCRLQMFASRLKPDMCRLHRDLWFGARPYLRVRRGAHGAQGNGRVTHPNNTMSAVIFMNFPSTSLGKAASRLCHCAEDSGRKATVSLPSLSRQKRISWSGDRRALSVISVVSRSVWAFL